MNSRFAHLRFNCIKCPINSPIVGLLAATQSGRASVEERPRARGEAEAEAARLVQPGAPNARGSGAPSDPARDRAMIFGIRIGLVQHEQLMFIVKYSYNRRIKWR